MEPNDLLRQCQKELLFNRTYDVKQDELCYCCDDGKEKLIVLIDCSDIAYKDMDYNSEKKVLDAFIQSCCCKCEGKNCTDHKEDNHMSK